MPRARRGATDERLSAKLMPICYWLGALTVMQALTMTKVFL